MSADKYDNPFNATLESPRQLVTAPWLMEKQILIKMKFRVMEDGEREDMEGRW